MAKLPIAVQGLELTSSSGTATVTSVPSVKVKAGGNGVYTTPLTVLVSGATQGNCIGDPSSGVINASGSKTMVGKILPLRASDNGTITINGTDSSSGSTCNFTVTVVISDAGQDKVLSE